jgi:hypothetical protein
MVKVGDILTWDYDSDVYQGQYRLIMDLGRNTFEAEHLEPSDELIDRVAQYVFNADPESFCAMGYHDPYGPERRLRTPQEALDAEILDRIERAGTTFKVEIVSRERFASHF